MKKMFFCFLLLAVQQISLVASLSDNQKEADVKTKDASSNKKNQNDDGKNADIEVKSFLDAFYMDIKDKSKAEINNENTKKIIEFGFLMVARIPSERCSDTAHAFLCNVLKEINNSAAVSSNTSSKAAVLKSDNQK